MARLPRIVIPGLPHHVTQRGNRRQQTFYEKDDYLTFKECLKQSCGQFGVQIWSYCLMPNHVHLVAVPETEEALSWAMGRGHEAYSRYMNFKMKWRGLLWQSRYRSFPMDEIHLYHAVRYVELNPVRAGMVKTPEAYPWSSARAHLGLEPDILLRRKPLLDLIEDWRSYLGEGLDEEVLARLRSHQRSGRPLGSREFIDELERRTGRTLHRKRPGPKGRS